MRKIISILVVAAPLVLGSRPTASSERLSLAPCPLAAQAAQDDLDDARVDLGVARKRFAAFEEIFALIEGLWNNDAIERMTYLKSKYDRDAAALALERAELDIERLSAFLDQVRLGCESARNEALRKSLDRYRRAQCEMRAKEVEIAEVNLIYRRELLASVERLRAGEVATRQDLVLARLGVEEEEVKLAQGRELLARCRRGLEQPGAQR